MMSAHGAVLAIAQRHGITLLLLSIPVSQYSVETVLAVGCRIIFLALVSMATGLNQ